MCMFCCSFRFNSLRFVALHRRRCVAFQFALFRCVLFAFSVLFRFNEISFHGKTCCLSFSLSLSFPPLLSLSLVFRCGGTCATNFPLNSRYNKKKESATHLTVNNWVLNTALPRLPVTAPPFPHLVCGLSTSGDWLNYFILCWYFVSVFLRGVLSKSFHCS